jgi:hypothetical protein
MPQGFFASGKFENSPEVAHGRETLPVPVPDVPENLFQQLRPRQTPADPHRHGKIHPIIILFKSELDFERNHQNLVN